MGIMAGGCGYGRPQKGVALPRQPNFIVFLPDALRADHLPCYGYPVPTAPRISAFAEANLCFEQCHAVATWTTPATASILTGTHPLLHRTVVTEWSEEGSRRANQYQVLPKSIPTTAQALEAAGYSTAFFQANPNASNERGLARGCTYYSIDVDARPGEHIDAVLNWLDTEAREPFYAYIHLIDPHEPYRAEPAIFDELTDSTMAGQLGELPPDEAAQLRHYHERDWNNLFLAGGRLGEETLRRFSPESIRYLSTLYDCEIREVDAAFGRLLERLRAKGWADRTVTVITSDHGEAFGEDGQFYHGNYIHDPQTHVPLILGIPGLSAGTRIPWTVSQLDIHMTLLHLAGIKADTVTTGAPLCGREGQILATGHRPVITALDLQNSDTTRWQFGVALGSLRVRVAEDPSAITVHELSGQRPDRQLLLTQLGLTNNYAERAALKAYFFERKALTEAAREVERPTWATAPDYSEDVFRAMGYL